MSGPLTFPLRHYPEQKKSEHLNPQMSERGSDYLIDRSLSIINLLQLFIWYMYI